MPERLRNRMRRLGLTAAVLMAVAGQGAMAAPEPAEIDLRRALGVLAERLEDPVALTQDNAQLLAETGLAPYAVASNPAGLALQGGKPIRNADPLEAQNLDMRLALTMLTQVAGATDHQAVLNARGAGSLDALVIRRGVASLRDLEQLVRHFRLQEPEAPGAPFVLRVPLVIWDGAGLTVGPAETLRLSRPDGAFIVNFGNLSITDATVQGVGPDNADTPRFSPFITTSGSGTVQVSGTRFAGLGFGRELKFSGFAVVRNNLSIVRGESFLRDSLFDGLVSVALGAVNDVLVTGNKFKDMRGPALILDRARHARVLQNLFFGQNDFNALQMFHGSSDAVVSGNVVLRGEKTGLALRDSSHNAYVAGNVVWGRVGGGIAYARSDCGQILHNHVIDNRHKGIEVRDSLGTLVADNTLIGNQSAGIWVSAQSESATTWLADNTLAANKLGLATATGAELVMVGNDFTRQLPRILGGDLSRQSHLIARNMAGEKAMRLTAVGAAPQPDTARPEVCRK